MYAQKFNVNVVIRGQARPCPLEWLDQFCMRNFTNAAEFDDTLPVADGQIESSFRLTPERFAEGLAAWLTQRGKGEGQPVVVQVTADPTAPAQRNPTPRINFVVATASSNRTRIACVAEIFPCSAHQKHSHMSFRTRRLLLSGAVRNLLS